MLATLVVAAIALGVVLSTALGAPDARSPLLVAAASFALAAVVVASVFVTRLHALSAHAGVAVARGARVADAAAGTRGVVGAGLRETLDAMQEGFQIIDRDWRYVYLNSNAAAHGHRERDDLLGRRMMDAYPGIEETPVFATLRDCMDRRKPAHLENHFVYPDGSAAWFELSVQPSPDGIVVVSMNITARKQAQADMQRLLAELDARNVELQEFTSFASHDLQEPLRKIRMFSDRLIREHEAALPASARDYLDRSVKAAERMQTLIDDLLALTRAAQDTPVQSIELGGVIAGAIENLEERVVATGGRVDVGPMPTLEGDATQLRQVFQNLIANALKFAAPDRTPLVRVTASATRMADGAPAWAITVEDNGIGFESKHAERIFAPFQRLHGRSQYEGTGIGLAIVRRIVDRHGGVAVAHGRPGEGASFTITLPQRQAPVAATR